MTRKTTSKMIKDFYLRQDKTEKMIFNCPVASRLTERQCRALQDRPSISEASEQELPIYRPTFCDRCPRFIRKGPQDHPSTNRKLKDSPPAT